MPRSPGKRILIVDDNKSIRTMVADYLGARGYEVIQASDGIKGLDSALSSDANVIILDVVMPGMDGVRLCHLLREKGLTTPIIMLTEKASLRDKEAGYGVGGLYVTGSTGEGIYLDLAIRKRLTEIAVSLSKGRGNVIVHVGAIQAAMATELAEHAARIGADAISSIPPFAGGYSWAEVQSFYADLARASKLPLIAYYIPGRDKSLYFTTGGVTFALAGKRVAGDRPRLRGHL